MGSASNSMPCWVKLENGNKWYKFSFQFVFLYFLWKLLSCIHLLTCAFDFCFLIKSIGGVPCNLCGNCTFQDNCSIHTLPNCLLACLLWDYVGSNCWGSFPTDDHAPCSCKTIYSAQVFQGGASSRLRRCRVWRSVCFTVWPSHCKSSNNNCFTYENPSHSTASFMLGICMFTETNKWLQFTCISYSKLYNH